MGRFGLFSRSTVGHGGRLAQGVSWQEVWAAKRRGKAARNDARVSNQFVKLKVGVNKDKISSLKEGKIRGIGKKSVFYEMAVAMVDFISSKRIVGAKNAKEKVYDELRKRNILKKPDLTYTRYAKGGNNPKPFGREDVSLIFDRLEREGIITIKNPE
ncbi:MAG TPA: hypothetical protein VJH23_00065 [archaeon]|nr:hypothetical protein [archaeon]